MPQFYEPTEEERLVALELLSNALLTFRMNRYSDESVMAAVTLANQLHNVPTFLMGRMGVEEAREHLEYLERELPKGMAAARHGVAQSLDCYRKDSH